MTDTQTETLGVSTPPQLSLPTTESHPQPESQRKLETIMNQMIPVEMRDLLDSNPDLLIKIKNLSEGEQLVHQIHTPYAMDAISFGGLMENLDIPWSDEERDDFQKQVLQVYMSLGGWISQRAPQDRYISLHVSTTNESITSDEVRTQKYQNFLEAVAELLAEKNNKYEKQVELKDVVLLACGTTIDPQTNPAAPAEFIFIKGPGGRVIAAQNMPATQDLIFAPIITTQHQNIAKNQEPNQLPLIVPGNSHTIELSKKGTTVGVDFVDKTEIPDIPKAPDLPREKSYSEELSHWVYNNLMCESYMTPREFYQLFKTQHPDYDLAANNHEILDVIIDHAVQMKTARYYFKFDSFGIATDISGMSKIASLIETQGDEQKPKLLRGFTSLLNLWQARVVSIYLDHGFFPDEIAGDGINAFAFGQDKTSVVKQIELAFAVQQSWKDTITAIANNTSTHQTSGEAQAKVFLEFLQKNNPDFEVVNKTAINNTIMIARWFHGQVDMVPKDAGRMGELLEEVKGELILNSKTPMVIVPQDLYKSKKDQIDQLFAVYKEVKSDDQVGVILVQKDPNLNTSPNTPRRELQILATP
jgi:hypothetical protein